MSKDVCAELLGLKDGELSGKKHEEAERLGIATQMEGGEDLLADLEGLRAKFEMVGSYPDLVAQAQLYDGKTEVDPVGQLLEQQRAQREREQELKEVDAEAYLRAKQAEAVPEFGFSVSEEEARGIFDRRVERWREMGVEPMRMVEYKGVTVDVATDVPLRQAYLDAQTVEYDRARAAWEAEVLPVLAKRYKGQKYRDVEAHVRAGKHKMAEVKQAVKEGLIPAAPDRAKFAQPKGLDAEGAGVLMRAREAYYADRQRRVLDLVDGVLGVNGVEMSSKSASTYFYMPYGKVRLADHMDVMRMIAPVQLRYDMTDAEVMEELERAKARGMGENFSMETVTENWINTLQSFVQIAPASGTPAYRKDIVVCPTPAVMQMVGAKAWDIVISPNILVKCLHKDTVLGNGKKLIEYYPKERHEHNIELSELMQLPASLADPVCIVESDTPGCIEVVTELKENGKNILVAVQLNSNMPGRDKNTKVNRIASLYGKNQINAILTHPRLYWNKAKARIWMKNGGLQSPTVVHQKQASKKKVLKPEDLVKYKQENNLSFSMTSEMEFIKLAAEADGTFMKAPNGKATNLTELQWLQVRTAAFKRWFGDWENDPANASKVVDENGEPLVVYHGSLQWFQIFNDGKERLNTAKAHRWMVVRGLQLTTKTKLSAGSNGRILTPKENLLPGRVSR